MRNDRNPGGFGIIEVLIASGIIGATIFSLYYVFILGTHLSVNAGNKISANFLAEEGLEAARYLRDASWTENIAGLTSGTDYFIAFDKNNLSWGISNSLQAPIDGIFYRKLTIENVSRDSNDDIVGSGGTNDPETKKINIEVAWRNKGATSTVFLSTYLTDLFDN